MPMFITDADRVWITTEGEIEERELTASTDAIAIYPAMPYAVQQRVIGTAVKATQRSGSQRTPRGRRDGGMDMTYDVAAYSLALLECNVLDWRGPSFTLPDGGKRPCTPEQIRALNPAEPLVAKVLAEIGARNQSADEEGDDPNAPEPAAT